MRFLTITEFSQRGYNDITFVVKPSVVYTENLFIISLVRTPQMVVVPAI